MTPDPIGLAGGINLYAYVQNNPVNLIDPYGLEPKLFKNQIRRTGNKKFIYKLVGQPTIFQKTKDIVALALPNGMAFNNRIEGEYFSEEWAKGDLLVDVCSDDQGNFLSRKELDFTPNPDSQYWITEENPNRVRDVGVIVETNNGRYLAHPYSDWRNK